MPHWNACANDGYTKRTYPSKKVLGDLCDLLTEAGRKQELVIEDEMNQHIRRKIERAEAKDPDEVQRIREDMLKHLLHFNRAMRLKIDSSERNDEVGKRLNNKAILSLYKRHRKEIEDMYDEDDRPKVFAILYEQTYFKSMDRIYRWKGEPYVFAWTIGHDHLTRIIADGEATSRGLGLAVTVARGSDQLLFGKKR